MYREMGINLFDQYTYLHFAVGIIVYFWDISLLEWSVIHTFFEILENTSWGMKLINRFPFWPGGKPYADSITNCVGDTIGAIIGWISAYMVDAIGVKYGWYEKHIKN